MVEINMDNKTNDRNKNPIKKGLIITFISALFIIVISVIIGLSKSEGFTSSNYLTYKNYVKIKNNMSYSEVVDIFDGHEGVLDTSSSYGGYSLSYYTWCNYSKTICIVVGFENNRVCTKSQYGLS